MTCETMHLRHYLNRTMMRARSDSAPVVLRDAKQRLLVTPKLMELWTSRASRCKRGVSRFTCTCYVGIFTALQRTSEFYFIVAVMCNCDVWTQEVPQGSQLHPGD